MKVAHTPSRSTSNISCGMTIPNKGKSVDKFQTALKELLKNFTKTNEIGRIDTPIIYKIEKPFADSHISEAKLKIESPEVKGDFRTRVLSMIAESDHLNGGTSVVIATGNKYAIESSLKDPKTAERFKTFIKEAIKDFMP